MKKLYLTFLWHMHQPYYKDDETGEYHLPWVFLHGIKDYLEMVRYYEIYNIRGVFNLVPSLIEQIIDLSKDIAKDMLLKMISKPTIILTEDEKLSILPSLFWANEKNMISASVRYKELYYKFKNERQQNVSLTELLDLQVHFLLSWTGTFIREESGFIKKLIQKDRYYTEEEKQQLLDILKSKFHYILPYYKKLYEIGSIEISTTPYYHPILPLLIDPISFHEALPDIALPENCYPLDNDAEWHLSKAIELFNNIFGTKPSGFWPAEGSVSTKTAELFIKHNVKWMASDEDILSRTLHINLQNLTDRPLLYKKYIYQKGEQRINIFFRDKKLSDLIGFVYANLDPEKAADDFIQHLKEIYELSDFSPHVSVILDGENAWEFYKNNARNFFEQLYQRISTSEWIETITFTDAIKNKDIPERTITSIAAGSWINGNFLTWMGHEEKNAAWKSLYQAIQDYYTSKPHLLEQQIEKIEKEIHIAEGSDWFWWFGDDHYTEQADVLDYLFRKHLINVYKNLNITIPQKLFEPIKKFHKKMKIKNPSSEIHTNFDGKLSQLEYLGSGEIDLKYDMSSMHTDANYLKKMKWGFNDEYLFIYISGNFSLIHTHKEDIILKINVDDTLIKLSLKNRHPENYSNILTLIDYRLDTDLELLFKIEDNYKNKEIEIYFELYSDDKLLEKAPLYNRIKLVLQPKNPHEWIV
ncbi:MAG: glycoside hydrolase family 57 protein [Calditerrivibrio sp.]|nr:glycoside hydrolase family 57 protein [Calditerrivibrio sp.]